MVIKKFLLLFLAVVSFVILISILRWQSFSIPLNSDEGLYAYFGSHLFKPGFIPYRDAFEQKLPGIFLLYKLAFYAFGENQFAVRMLNLINSIVAASLIFLLLKKIQKNYLWAYILTTIYIFFTNWFDTFFSVPDIFFTTILIFTILLFVYFIDQPKLNPFQGLVLGLLIGLSYLIKQSAIFDVIIIPIWLYLFRKKDLKSFLPAYLFGAAFPFLIVAVIFWQAGLWFYFNESIFYFQSKYTLDGIQALFQRVVLQGDLFRLTHLTHTAGLLVLTSLICYWKYRKVIAKNRMAGFFIIGIIITIIQAKIQWREAGPYYFPLAAFVIAFYALLPKEKFTKVIIFSSLVIFFIIWGKLWFYPAKEAYVKFAGSEAPLKRYYIARDIGEEIKRRTNKDDKILSFTEETEILFYADRDSPTRFTQTVMFWFPYYKQEIIRAFNNGTSVVVAFENTIPEEIRKSLLEDGFTKTEKANGIFVYRKPGLN